MQHVRGALARTALHSNPARQRLSGGTLARYRCRQLSLAVNQELKGINFF